MKQDPKMIQHLNNVLGNELIAINQYFLHSKILKDWGLTNWLIKNMKNQLMK